MQKKFEDIFKTFYPPVKKFAGMIVKSSHDAEDIAQEVFTQLWAKPEVWADNPDIDRYIFKMTKYQALSHLRHRNYVASQITDADMDLVSTVLDDQSDADPVVYNEIALLLKLAVDRLPEKRRQIFRMSREEDLSHKEIAQRLGISVRTVEAHIYAALSDLRKVLPMLLFML